MKIAVASGKGGVGKSMLASSLALLFSKGQRVVAVDCDADAPNLNLWLGLTDWEKELKVSTSEKSAIDPKKCTGCGKCLEPCRFGAILKDGKTGKYKVNGLLCEGCGCCELVCPVSAPAMQKVQNGLIRLNLKKPPLPIVSGALFPGERCSGKLVAEARKEADKLPFEVMVLDSAAGIGCTVNASLVNTDFAVLVTEPTPSGLSDLERVLEVVKHFKIPYGFVVNQWDINKGFSRKIEGFAGKQLLGKIPHDRNVIESIVELRPVLERSCPASKAIDGIFERLTGRIGKPR